MPSIFLEIILFVGVVILVGSDGSSGFVSLLELRVSSPTSLFWLPFGKLNPILYVQPLIFKIFMDELVATFCFAFTYTFVPTTLMTKVFDEAFVNLFAVGSIFTEDGSAEEVAARAFSFR